MNRTADHKTALKKPDDAFVVHRVLPIQGMRTQNDVEIIQGHLAKLKGVQAFDVNLKKSKVKITYNAAQTDFGIIEKTLNDSGYSPKNSRWSKFKSSWYRYLDENAQTNAKSKGGACCSNPSDIYANRKK